MPTAVAAGLIESLGTNDHVLRANLAGLTHEESVFMPRPAGSCLNWTLGHIVVYRDQMVRMLGGEGLWSDDDKKSYVAGTAWMDGAGARELLELVADFTTLHARLCASLGAVSLSQLERKHGDATIGTYLAKLVWHETYHIGQLGLQRRLAGKSGAI